MGHDGGPHAGLATTTPRVAINAPGYGVREARNTVFADRTPPSLAATFSCDFARGWRPLLSHFY